MNSTFWRPVDVGDLHLDHRIVMAPMTRSRATSAGVPTGMNAEYYAQRASVALIVSEGTQPSEDGQGYITTPGIHNEEQVAGWRQVTEAVHDAGGQIFIQLMHTGRISHPLNTPHGRQPVAPSAVKPSGQMFTAKGMQELPEPRALLTDEAAATVQHFRQAAAAAIEAGADGVEIHGANGYLVHQFLSSNANERTDEYGGSVSNRIRFAVEVASAVAEEIGAARTGFQISPGNPFNDVVEDDVSELYEALLQELAPLGLAYLNLAQGDNQAILRTIRRQWPGTLLLNRGGATVERRAADLEQGNADLVSFGRPVLANPDLVARIRDEEPLNEADPSTFYGGDEHGYIDYPTLAAAAR